MPIPATLGCVVLRVDGLGMTVVGVHASHEQIHPSALLQAMQAAAAAGFTAATLAAMYPGRFWVALGTTAWWPWTAPRCGPLPEDPRCSSERRSRSLCAGSPGSERPAHVRPPGIRPGLPATAGALLAAEGSADLRTRCPDVDVHDAAVRAISSHELFGLALIAGEDR